MRPHSSISFIAKWNLFIKDMENLHLLTRDEIADKLKAMEVGEGKELPMKGLSFIVENRKYDPDSFSQEIEDSEERIDELELINREIHQPGFDFV